MQKFVYVIPIFESIFNNNHFQLVKDALTSKDEVVIFLMLNSEDKYISLDLKKEMIQSYFNEDELNDLKLISYDLSKDNSIDDLINDVTLFTKKNGLDVQIIVDYKYLPKIASKKPIIVDSESKEPTIKYFISNNLYRADLATKKDFNDLIFTNETYPETKPFDIETYDLNKESFNLILDNKLFIYDELDKLIGGHRLLHSISVANLCYDVAESNKLKQPYKYFIAGLLHDIGKHYGDAQSLKLMKSKFNEYVDLPEFSYHQFIGVELCKRIFKVSNEEILTAIKYHCTGNDHMTTMGKIVYACDKIDPLRGYDSKDMINAMMKDYESGFEYVIRENLKFISSKSKMELEQFDRLSKSCFKKYSN